MCQEQVLLIMYVYIFFIFSIVFFFLLHTVWKHWTLLDTRIGAWLLDADNTHATFSDLLAKHGLQQEDVDVVPNDDFLKNMNQVHQDLCLLGPLMVKLYTKLKV